MVRGILGKKVGMTQIFDDDGRVIPVTVVEAGPCVVVQRKLWSTLQSTTREDMRVCARVGGKLTNADEVQPHQQLLVAVERHP